MTIGVLEAKAQIDNLFTFNTSNQQIVQSAVGEVFMNITCSYRIQDVDTRKLYGRNGNEVFGTVSSWGIKIDKGLILLDQAVHPWNYDENFNKYRGKYNAIPYQITFAEKNSSFGIDSVNIEVCNHRNLLFAVEDTLVIKDKGLIPDSSDGEKKGWIVWLAEEGDSTRTFLVFKKEIEFKPDVAVYEVEQPNTSKKIIAGIYVQPSYPFTGCVLFNLCGVLVEQNGKWVLARLSMPSDDTNNPRTRKERDESEEIDSDLTPVDEIINNSNKE